MYALFLWLRLGIRILSDRGVVVEHGRLHKNACIFMVSEFGAIV